MEVNMKVQHSTKQVEFWTQGAVNAWVGTVSVETIAGDDGKVVLWREYDEHQCMHNFHRPFGHYIGADGKECRFEPIHKEVGETYWLDNGRSSRRFDRDSNGKWVEKLGRVSDGLSEIERSIVRDYDLYDLRKPAILGILRKSVTYLKSQSWDGLDSEECANITSNISKLLAKLEGDNSPWIGWARNPYTGEQKHYNHPGVRFTPEGESFYDQAAKTWMLKTSENEHRFHEGLCSFV